MVRVMPYAVHLMKEWDRFVSESRNGTFLFKRAYMDYHADRFEDSSLLFYDDETLIGLMPCNKRDDTFISHGGLTYGGIVAGCSMTTMRMLSLFSALRQYLFEQGIKHLIYKALPHIYHVGPSEEDLYALFVSGATLVRRDISSTIYLPGFRLPGKRLRGAGKAERSGIAVRTSHDFPVFIMLLNERLQDKYGRQAVHTAEEIGMLAGRFPDNIRLYGAYLDGTMIAGAILYISGQTVHLQYSGTSEAGRSLRALDALITHIITAEYGNHRWFDFGISTEQDGRYLNEGLMRQKEEFGASAVCYDTYSLEMAV